MGLNVKYATKRDGLREMKERLENINGSAVEVGVLKGEHKWIAAIHEYGLDIEVTPAMRSYLHRNGMHLKKSTTHIHIPERSFLRTGYDTNKGDILKKAREMLADVAAGRMKESALYEGIGTELADAIKDYAVELRDPANHPFTIERKGSSNPLVGTGDMVDGITWREAK